MNKKHTVLIVDDSAVMRQLLQSILSSDPALEVIGTAPDPIVAQEKVLRLQPDILTLDVEMPRMDGLTFLEKLMRARPMPVVMISSLTKRGCDATLRALELGAVDYVAKPSNDVANGVSLMAAEIVSKVKAAIRARIRPVVRPAAQPPTSPRPAMYSSTHKVVAIGASTGGTEALKEVLVRMPPDSPGVVIVQHMPEQFTRAFAQRLDSLGRLRVSEARDGDRILPGHALLAPGNFHMEVFRSGADQRVRITTAERVNHHRPSVDVLFRSCARHLGGNAIGVILTGMGNDGASGMAEMARTGAYNIAQDEATSVIFGMPKEAISAGGVHEVLPLENIPGAILKRIYATRN